MAGSPRGMDLLFDVYYKRLVTWADTYLDYLQAAEDLVQEFLVDLWENRKVREWRPESLQSFLFISIRNRSLHLLEKKDVLAIMPTGAGKSLCFQIPALMMDGISLVISPLISLMKDQVDSLLEIGISAAYLNSSMDAGEYQVTMLQARQGIYRILYVAPERLQTEGFLSFAEQVEISMVSVDEAHCVSQWGQDFRQSYLGIAEFLNKLQKRPIVSAFTATATEQVCKDICRLLQLQDPFQITTGFDRKNLYFAVRTPRIKERELLELLQERRGKSGIVYCLARKTVETLYARLY